MYEFITYLILCALLIIALLTYERNCKLRRKLVSERGTKEYLLLENKRQSAAIERYKKQETNLRTAIRLQESVIMDLTPQHSDERPVVDFPMNFDFEFNPTAEENIIAGKSTVI